MIDTAHLKESTDLLALVGESVTLRKVSGAEYAGPCPRCGGTDRFHVDSDKGWWFCRQCYDYENGQAHDAIAYMQWLHGVGFKEACEMLGADPSSSSTRSPRPTPRPTIPQAETPAGTWQEMAGRFIAFCEAKLWETPDALAYLVDRGLDHDTIRAAHLGYNPRQYRRDPATWGLDREKPIWLPRGWTIPCWMDGQLRYVKVRRLDHDIAAAVKHNESLTGKKGRWLDDKYIAIAGSKKGKVIYGLDDMPACDDLILCEGELDALLLRQHLGAISAVVATGAAKALGGAHATMRMIPYRRHWTTHDTDPAGQEGAKKWGELSARVRRLLPPDHDVTDAWRAGHDLVAWAVAGIGPSDHDKRRAWLIDTMTRLDAGIVDPSEESDPDLVRWMACYAELCALEGWTSPDEKSRSGSDSAEKGYTYVPFGSPKTCQNVSLEASITDMLAYFSKVCGGAWREVPAPGDLAASYAWCAERHRFYESDTGELLSVPVANE